MVPVLGKDDLEISAASIGAISSLEGASAFVGALMVARFIGPGGYRRCYYYSTCAYLAVVFVLGLVPSVPLLAGCLVAAGLAGAGFATMQSTLIYQAAPADMRGRMFGLVTICIGSGLIGFANIGLLAEYFGTADALWIMALQGVIPTVLIGLAWPQLYR
jgi:MFS family permease